jgi:hypothetical protein
MPRSTALKCGEDANECTVGTYNEPTFCVIQSQKKCHETTSAIRLSKRGGQTIDLTMQVRHPEAYGFPGPHATAISNRTTISIPLSPFVSSDKHRLRD